jgi:DNA polymerase-3 subunit alpha
MRLCSRAYLETGAQERPHIKIAWLAGETEGLIALSGGPNGPLDGAIVAGQNAVAVSRCERLQELFGDRLYIELQRHGMASEKIAEPQLVDLAYARGLPLVAANEPFFASRDDYEAHDALLCIAEGKLIADGDRRQLTAEHRFKTRAEIAALFADLPETLATTVEIAQRCVFRPHSQAPILPRFASGRNERAAMVGEAKGQQGQAQEAEEAQEAQELRRAARSGLERRLQRYGTAPGHSVEDYNERLEFELGVIVNMHYAGYFLIVADFIQWAKAQDIPVGPGRGSGAGSLVAYALTITDLDPIRFGLLFERFLNPERISMPDFDVDFCQDRRDEVIRYVQEKYGRDQVAQIITFGTLQARGVLRDVGRVLQMPYGQVDRLCKLVPQNPANPISLGRAIEDEPRSRDAPSLRHRAKARRSHPARLDPRRRHRDWRSAAHRTGAALSRSEVADAGDPVQYEMGRARGAGEIRFPWLENAHGARSRRQARAPTWHRNRSVQSAAR